MIKASNLDWNRIEAARRNAHFLRSEAAYDTAVAIRNGMRRLLTAARLLLDGNALPVSKTFARPRQNSAKAPFQPAKGLQAGWY